MPSTSATASRRKPQQARAALRRANFLKVAARLIGESGYDAVTMTAIAEQADASIGTLYDYFPDKQALTLALLTQYAEEMDAHWALLLQTAQSLDKTQLADLLIEGALDFLRARPAYLPLHSAPILYARSPAAREPLRRTIGSALQRVNPELSAEAAFLRAKVVVELIKGLFSVSKQVEAEDRETVSADFKKLMRFYLTEVVE